MEIAAGNSLVSIHIKWLYVTDIAHPVATQPP